MSKEQATSRDTCHDILPLQDGPTHIILAVKSESYQCRSTLAVPARVQNLHDHCATMVVHCLRYGPVSRDIIFRGHQTSIE